MKNLFFILLTFCLTSKAAAQYQEIQPVKSLVKIPAVLGISYERKIGYQFTLTAQSCITPNAYLYLSSDENKAMFWLNPYVKGFFRHYLNLQERLENNKRVEYNSGNYWGIMTAFQFDPLLNKDNTDPLFQDYAASNFSIGPVLGMQRSSKKGFSLDLGIGYGLVKTNYKTEGDLLSYLSIEYYFKSKEEDKN